MKPLVLFGVLCLSAIPAGMAAPDSRQYVELPEPMQQHLLANMRAHLEVIDRLLALLSAEELDAASELAESELGMSSLNKHGAAHIAPHYPQAMRQLGTSMHRAASRFSRVAQEGEALAAYRALGDITSSCVACHAGYRIR